VNFTFTFTLLRGKKCDLFDNSSVSQMCFPDVQLLEDDLKKIEICGNNSGLYVTVLSILVHLLVLSVKQQ